MFTEKDEDALGRLYVENLGTEEIAPVTLGRLKKRHLVTPPSNDPEFRGMIYITESGREAWRQIAREREAILKLANGKQEVRWNTNAAHEDWLARMEALRTRNLVGYDGHGGYDLTAAGWKKAVAIRILGLTATILAFRMG